MTRPERACRSLSVHAQPLAAVTVTLLVPPAAPTDALVGEMLNVHPVPPPPPAVTRTLSRAGPKLLDASRLSNSNVVLELLAVNAHVCVVHPMLVVVWPVMSKVKVDDWPAA